jgi:hypothetical protein
LQFFAQKYAALQDEMHIMNLHSVQMNHDLKTRQQAWLRAILQRTGLKPSQLANAAGLNTTTLTRFLNSIDHKNALSAQSVAAIQEAVKGFSRTMSAQDLQAIAYPGMPETLKGEIAEDEAAPYTADLKNADHGYSDAAIKAIVEGQAGLDPWVLKSRSLEASGYLPGDVLIVSLNEEPRDNDVVCVQIYDWSLMKAETVMRVYQQPYISASEFGVVRKPLLVDNKDVMIKGVVVAGIRPRRNSM